MTLRKPRLLLAGQPPELIVFDEPTPCPYLPGKTARLPMRLPARPLTREEFSQRLQSGDRRQGLVLYRPSCDECQACEAIRIDVRRFEPNRGQRRVLKKGDRALVTSLGIPVLDAERVELYNRHKLGRRLLGDGELIDESGYGSFLVESCTESFELRYRSGDRLSGVAIVDRSHEALSAVYTYFDPDVSKLSPGVYSILKQIELCQRWGLRWLYLGLYVAGCPAMTYKTSWRPHERLIDGQWQMFER